MRKTKIICTIGPASNTVEKISELIDSGMNVARLNFSHGTHDSHKIIIDNIKSARNLQQKPIAIMLDTKGPEYRIQNFKDDKIMVKNGSKFTFTMDDIIGDNMRVSVNYKGLVNDLTIGDKILVNNGLVVFEVKEIRGQDIICNTLVGGILSNKKSMSFPNKTLNQIYLGEQDKSDILSK